MTQVIFPEWRDMQGDSKYPFVDTADLSNGTIVFTKSMFVDARLVAIGGGPRQYISRVVISTSSAIIHIADEAGELSTGEVIFGNSQTRRPMATRPITDPQRRMSLYQRRRFSLTAFASRREASL